MKKLSLLFLSICTVLGVSAQTRKDMSVAKAQASMKSVDFAKMAQSIQAQEMTNTVYENGVIPFQKVVSASDTALYLKPIGSFYGGIFMNNDNTYPRIIVPATVDMTYRNASSNFISYVWSVNGTQVATTKDYTATGGYPFGAFYLPTLKTANGSYTYGDVVAPTNNAVMSGLDYTMPLTNCAMYTSGVLRANGYDYFRIGAGTSGAYAYGTNLTVSGKTADTLGVFFNNVSTMYIDSVALPIYNNTLTETMIPDGATLKLTIYNVDSTATGGYTITNQVLGTATATVADTTAYIKGTSIQYGVLGFVFKATNALGISSPKPLIINGPFFAQLTGYNESGCKFGIYSDYYNPENSNYFTVNGKLTSVWKHGNLAMSLNAILPVLTPDTTDLHYSIPADGSTPAVNNSNFIPGVYATFAPTADLGAWTYTNLPEWLTVTTDETYFSNYNFVSIKFTADALPTGVNGRSADVTINSLGKTVTYNISQGVVSSINQSKGSGISYSRTSNAFVVANASNYSTVKLLDTTGKLIGNYAVNGSNVSVPSTGLSKGIYLLKFEGSKGTESIKVVK